jgi:FeS assembly SUF system protein
VVNEFDDGLSDCPAHENDPAKPPDTGAESHAGEALVNRKAIEDKVVEVLKETYDPEIPVNIYDLGMIYNIDVKPDASVEVKMTLTSPMCPVAGTLPGEVETRIRAIPEVKDARIDLVWDPPWDRDMMSEAAKLTLGFF